MLRLANIRKKDNIIECDYLDPSQKETPGHLVYDINKHDYVSIEYSSSQSEDVHYGFSHLTQMIEDMITYNKYPDSINVFWY